MNSVFALGGAGGITCDQALQDALAAKGTSLSDVFNDWSTVQMTGYGIATLDALKPTSYFVPAEAGAKTQASAASTSTSITSPRATSSSTRGDGDTSTACFAATLSLT